MTNRSPADKSQEIVVYAGPGVEISLPLDRERETVWASQAQIVELFGLNVSSVSTHINNIFRDSEVDRESNLQKVQIASADRPGRTTAWTSFSPSATVPTCDQTNPNKLPFFPASPIASHVDLRNRKPLLNPLMYASITCFS
jgi:hypothetical protein